MLVRYCILLSCFESSLVTWPLFLMSVQTNKMFPSSSPVSKMSAVPKVQLSGGLEICRILNGMWQLSGAHGKVDRVKAGDPDSGCHWNIHNKGRIGGRGGYQLLFIAPKTLWMCQQWTCSQLHVLFLPLHHPTTFTIIISSCIVLVCVIISSYYIFHNFLVIAVVVVDVICSCSTDAVTFPLQSRKCRPMSTLDWQHSTWQTYMGLQRKYLDSSTVRYTHTLVWLGLIPEVLCPVCFGSVMVLAAGSEVPLEPCTGRSRQLLRSSSGFLHCNSLLINRCVLCPSCLQWLSV